MDFIIEGDDSLNAKHENKHLKQTKWNAFLQLELPFLNSNDSRWKQERKFSDSTVYIFLFSSEKSYLKMFFGIKLCIISGKTFFDSAPSSFLFDDFLEVYDSMWVLEVLFVRLNSF